MPSKIKLKSKSTSKKSKKKSKKQTTYEVLPCLQPGARYTTKPQEFQAELQIKGMFRYKTSMVVLSNGKLVVKRKNGTKRHSIDLGVSVVAFFKSAKRISINTENEMYRFRAKSIESFNDWLERIRVHRLYRQDKIQYAKPDRSSSPSLLTLNSSATEKQKKEVHLIQVATKEIIAREESDDTKRLRKLQRDLQQQLMGITQAISEAEKKTFIKCDDAIFLKIKEKTIFTLQLNKMFEDEINKRSKQTATNKIQTSPSRSQKSPDESPKPSIHENLAQNILTKKLNRSKGSSPKSLKSEASPISQETDTGDEDASESSHKTTLPVEKFEVEVEAPAVPHVKAFEYRTVLPVKMKVFNLSIWSILKQAIGKDITRITFPVELFEPLSVLQVLCEELEYSDLLDLASKTESKSLRMALVAAFAVSRYASTVSRIYRKPFNPIEGETYENVREDLGWWFFAEQISHHPAIAAIHAKGKDWEISQSVSYDLSFWGRSIQAEPKSPVDLVLHKFHETYRWNKVKTSVNNLLIGKRYIDHIGDMIIKCSNNLSCKLTFKRCTHEVIGSCHDEENKVVFNMKGKWSGSLSVDLEGNEQPIWTANSLPKNSADYYGFSHLAMTLNELTAEMRLVLPPTDSRFRTDERCLEEGRLEEARTQKDLLEKSQRARRKQQTYKPKWFKMEVVPKAKINTYRFNNLYWESRKNKFAHECFDELWPANV